MKKSNKGQEVSVMFWILISIIVITILIFIATQMIGIIEKPAI